jgi:hypothetical protein
VHGLPGGRETLLRAGARNRRGIHLRLRFWPLIAVAALQWMTSAIGELMNLAVRDSADVGSVVGEVPAMTPGEVRYGW